LQDEWLDVCKGGGPPLSFFFIYGALVMKRAVAAENDLIICTRSPRFFTLKKIRAFA